MLIAIAWSALQVVPQVSHATDANQTSSASVCPAGIAANKLFADLFIQELRRGGVTSEILYDPQDFRLKLPQEDGSTAYAFLGNAQADYCKAEDDAERRAVLSGYASVWTSPETAQPGPLPQSLLPAVRGRTYLELSRLRVGLDHDLVGSDPRHYFTTLGTDIAVTLARDSEATVGLLNEHSYQEIGVSQPEALELALANLRARTDDNWIEVGPSLFRSGWTDFYDPARLLLPEVIRRLPIKGNPVALAVDNDTLFVTGSANKSGLLELNVRAREAFDVATRPLSGHAIVLIDGKWVDYLPTDPDLHVLNDLRKERLYIDYAEQGALLQQLNEKRGDDVYVAKYDLFQKSADDELMSFTTWAGGIASLLPHTDFIGFVEDPDAEPVIVPWDAARGIVGEMMAESDYYPTRYRVERFPNTAQLELLKKSAL